jgi:hypothetical protein
MHGIPIVAIVLVVRLILAAINAAANQKLGGGSGGPRANLAFGRGSSAIAYTILLWAFIAPAFIGFSVALFSEPWLLPVALVLGAVLFPYLTTRYLLIPLGLGRTAWVLNKLPSIVWRNDRPGGANLTAAWAFSRRGDDKGLAWLENKIARAKPLRGASVAAQALVTARRGDKDSARVLFESLETFERRVCPSMALRIAREWRIADALGRRDHAALKELLREKGPRSRASRMLLRIARHLVGQAELNAPWLWILWAIAPRRRFTFALVAGATRERFGAIRAPRAPTVSIFMAEGARPIEQALRLEAAMLARDSKALNARDVAELGRRWDEALGGEELELRIATRAQALGVSAIDRVKETLERSLEEDLMKMILRGELKLALLSKGGGMIERAVRRVRSDLFAEIETGMRAIRGRTDEERALPGIDEWREWTSLRRMLERSGEIGGIDVRRLRFPEVHGAVCHVAVWLFNARKERAIGNAMFRWLLDEANAVKNEQAIDLETKNVKCGPI